MLDDGAGRDVLPFHGQIPGRFHIDDIIVGQFLAVELLCRCDAARFFRVLVEGRLLMGIFAVAQFLDLRVSKAEHVRHIALVAAHLFSR